MPSKLLLALSCCLSVATGTALAQPTPTIKIAIDITDAPRKILRAELSIPVQPGSLTLVYPKWIPGEHGPTGPIDNFTGLTFTGDNQTLPWKRDDLDMYAFHVNVPEGVKNLQVKAEFLATAAATGFSAGASTAANLAIVSWNEFILYPAGFSASSVRLEPSIKLPDDDRSLSEAARQKGLSEGRAVVPGRFGPSRKKEAAARRFGNCELWVFECGCDPGNAG